MAETTDIVAVIFDFDDTLVPDSTSKLLKAHGIDVSKFWRQDAAALIKEGYDPPTAYLRLLLDNIGPDKPLGLLTNEKLREFGATLDGDFYRGLPAFFEEVQQRVAEDYDESVKVEFYIISGGLQEIVQGSKIVQKYFKATYGCHLGSGETESGVLKYIKRSITFTEKTRYIFEINKGVPPDKSWQDPLLVNKFVSPEERRIPLHNMIYVGDGLTDIPCFSLLKVNKGLSFGVFDPSEESKAKRALEEFLQPDRVISMHAPRYDHDSELGAVLRAAIASRCANAQLERQQPRRTR